MGIVAHAGSLALKHECRQCQRGEGVFRECSVNTYWPYGSQNGACTSCAYLGRAAGCSLLDARRLYIGGMFMILSFVFAFIYFFYFSSFFLELLQN